MKDHLNESYFLNKQAYFSAFAQMSDERHFMNIVGIAFLFSSFQVSNVFGTILSQLDYVARRQSRPLLVGERYCVVAVSLLRLRAFSSKNCYSVPYTYFMSRFCVFFSCRFDVSRGFFYRFSTNGVTTRF